MNTDVVKAFNAELTSIYDQRPPLSKKKIQDVSKAALKAKTYYKHVVFSVEKFLAKCKVEYKIPVLYVVDSIIRASKHQFKEKDVFGPRFLKNFAKTLNDFLQCPVNEQCRVVRTLNLWGANGVFEESVLASFKEQCRNMGIETDVELVERAVKGKRADMTIYGGTYIKKEHRSHSKYEAKTPPMPPPNAGDKSQLAVKEEPSEEIPQGCISERELLNIMQSAGCDYGGSFSTDLALLRKAHSIFCDALVQRQSAIIAEQKAGNIKNLLSSQFDYSDEEDSGDEAKKNEVNEPKPMTHDQVVQMAENLVKDPTVMDAFKTLHQERVMVLNQVALIAQQREKLINDLQHQQHHPHLQHQQQHQQQQQQQQQPNPTTVGMPMGVPPPSLGQLNTGIPPGLPGSGIAGLTAGFPLGQGIGNIANLAGLGQLTGFAGLQQIVPNNGNNAQGILGMLNPLGLLPQSAGLGRGQGLSQQNIEEIMAQQQIKMNNSLNSQNATSLGGLLGTVPNAQLSLDDLDPRREMDDKDSHRRKRSRSTERDDHKRSRASRSKDKDRSDRERRKLGLPPNSEGLTMIASKTLWFGRLPPLITDNEIKMALRPTGEVERISIISSKACAYVAMDSRKNAYEVVHKLGRDMKINGKTVKIGWAQGNGAKVEPYSKWWDSEKGVTLIPWNELPGDLERLCDGAYLDVESLPPNKKGMYSDAGVLSVMIPSGSDPTGMELSSPQASPPRVPGLSFDGTSPMKPHEFAPFGVPPPLPLNSMPGNPNVLPPGLQNPLQFPMRLPPMGRPPIPNQALIPPNVTLPPPTPNTPQPPFNSHNPVGNMFSPTRGNFRGGRGRGFAPGPSRGGNAGRGGFRGGINAGCSDGDRGDWGNDRKDRESRWNGRDDRNSRWENRDDRERDSDRRRERDADRGERRRSRWGDSREERGDRRDRWDEDRDRYRDDRFNRDRRRDRDDGGRRDRGGRRERESPKYSDGENDQTNVNDSEHTAAATEPNVASFPSGDDAVVTSTTDDITAIAESESKRQFEEQIRGDIKSGEDLLETAVAAPASEN